MRSPPIAALLLLLLLPPLQLCSALPNPWNSHSHQSHRRFNSPEHIRLGDMINILPGLVDRKVHLPNGLSFTFGELVSLYGA